MIRRYHVFVEGRVQGVGFRGFCMVRANRYGLTGSVKNLPNGT
ncbi:MAG: acylphosphatase, partial [Erysipelotrichaceae bacterium]|nr:acylphosphatase [Erysipelotrichaceae bacterium]